MSASGRSKLPKRAEARSDAWTRPALARRLEAMQPEARAAAKVLEEAALRLFNATDGGDEAAALLRFMADDFDALCSTKPAAHRPVGSSKYDSPVRCAMIAVEGHTFIQQQGSKVGQDQLLARALYKHQGGKPGKYGATVDGIYRTILRIREVDKRARQAAVEELGAEKAERLGSLATFLYRGRGPGEP